MACSLVMGCLALWLFYRYARRVQKRKKMFMGFYERLEHQTEAVLDGQLVRQVYEHSIRYQERLWAVYLGHQPQQNGLKFRIHISTQHTKLPAWFMLSMVNAKEISLFTPGGTSHLQPIHHPIIDDLLSLSFNAFRLERLIMKHEHFLFVLGASTLEQDVAAETIELLHKLSEVLDTLVVDDGIFDFLWAIQQAHSPESEVGQHCLITLIHYHFDREVVQALWLDQMEDMARPLAMSLLQKAPKHAQDFYFEQERSREQWLVDVLALQETDFSELLNTCFWLACSDLSFKALEAIGAQYDKLRGLLFVRLWPSSAHERFLSISQSWWQGMSDDELFECMSLVIADVPHLVEWWMFDVFMLRWPKLKPAQKSVVVKWFASRITTSTHWFEPPDFSSVLLRMLPHLELSDAQIVLDVFKTHAPKAHYAPIYKRVRVYTMHSAPPAIKLFAQWFDALKEDPNMLGALSVSDGAEVPGALTDVNVTEGQLSASTQESS